VDGMGVVGVEGGPVGELHYAAECVALRAWGKVRPDVGFEQAGDLSLQGADFGLGAELLFLGDAGFPVEGEGVDDHGAIMAKVVAAMQWRKGKAKGGQKDLKLCLTSSQFANPMNRG